MVWLVLRAMKLKGLPESMDKDLAQNDHASVTGSSLN
jgi:hypothetical protein